jgi:peptidyl-prolyl cis-trans isomerase D
VTDAEILAYMKKNEKKFKAETREVEYVLIADEASKRMRLELKKE